jgi:adenylate kinase
MSFINIILFGAPGSGKGTQSKILSQDFNLFHLSTGDLLREVKSDVNSVFHSQVSEKMAKGELVNDEIIFGIVSNKINQIKTEKKFDGIIFDGFPRNVTQAKFLNDELKKFNFPNPFVFILNISFEAVVNRILNRFTCSNCGAIYNKVSKPPKREEFCDVCNIKNSFSDRVDDTPDVIKNRLEIFEKNMKNLKEFYANQASEIDASLNSKEVFNILKKKLENLKKI